MELVADAQGRSRYLRVLDKRMVVEDYTGRPAMSCDGKAINDELVVTYGLESDGRWRTEANGRSEHHTMPAYFEILNANPTGGPLTPDRRAHGPRALVAPFSSDSIRPGAHINQPIWLDVETLLPVRWELGRAEPGAPIDWGLSFVYDPDLKVAPPEGVKAPTCIRSH